jgi:anti-anti-sigma factor
VESGFWAAIVGRVLRHPWISAIVAGGLLVVIAIPTLRLHTANSGVQGLPRDLPVMQTYDRIQKAFPGEPIAAIIALKAPDVTRLQVTAAIREMRNRAVATGLMRDPVTIVTSRDRSVAQVSVPLAGNGTDDTSNRALETLRNDVIPQTIGRLPGAQAPVTGLTAGSFDFNELIKSRAPWVFVFVLSLAFLLLLVTFRSIVIPVKAIVLNLLSVGAAYGVLVWIFQDGHLESLLGFTSIGGITSWLPLFLFVILFGLSMDYHVFILSRVREGFDRGMNTEEAISHGIKATAGIVTSAAAVMIAVFSVFATLSSIDFKEMGVGLATAVLIDATIVRAVLLPASMKLLGDWNWYLPSWLGWLPEVAPEPGTHHPEVYPSRLAVEIERANGRVSLALEGELDLETAPRFRERLAEAEPGAETVVIDLRGVTFIDSCGLGELSGAHQRAHREGRRLVVVRDRDTPLDRALNVTHLDRWLEMTEDPTALRS